MRWITLLLLSVGIAKAQEPVGACEEPNVLIVLDRSGSMLEGGKWQQATEAITQLTRTFEHAIRFGLMVFPWDGRCSVDRDAATLVSPAPLNGPNIRNAFLRARPERTNLTPIGTAVYAGRRFLEVFAQDGRRSFLVLLTDGMETCDGNPVADAEQSFARGVPVFVIGFGGGVDRNTLQRMAQAGGTGMAYQANNGRELFEAFQAIADAATEEICDGADNDCDGLVDERLPPRACETPCGAGEQICVDGGYSECRGGAIPDEVCDGVDNDCDTLVDEVQRVPCVTVSGNAGTAECVEGVVDEECLPDDPNREEICDLVDNDQDGLVDEGTDRPCAEDCHQGRRLCLEGSFTRCNALPAGPEVCNGVDDDCDGRVDESAECAPDEICGHEGLCLRPCLQGECPDHFTCAPDEFCHPRLCDPFCAADETCVLEVCRRPCVLDQECGDGGRCRGRLCVGADMPDPEDPFDVPPPVIQLDVGPSVPQDMGPGAADDAGGGCSCRADAGAGWWLWALALLGLSLRRRRSPARR